MSFGFSVGDFVADGKLIGEIVSSLQSVGGARSEYQELIRELKSLDKTLRHLDRLDHEGTPSDVVDSIKFAALSCRVPLEDFLVKAKRYEKSLGPWSRPHVVQAAAGKLGWTFGRKDDIRRMQTYLNMHIGTINILLTEHGLERMALNDKRAEARTLQIREQLDGANSVLEDIKKDLPAQALVLRSMHSMLGGLYKLVYGDMRTSLHHFCQVVNKVCVSTQQIYTVVLEIRDTLTGPDTRWTYLQAPFRVEDALGFQFPVPSEYDYDMLITIIQRRFQKGAGSLDVRAGNYELCKTKKSSELVTAGTRLTPGTAITMAIIIFTPRASNASCPMPGCGSSKATPCPGGAFICCACDVKFDRAAKKRRRVEELHEGIEKHENATISPRSHCSTCSCCTPRKRTKTGETADTDQSAGFRNVRWALDDERAVPLKHSQSLLDTTSTRVPPIPAKIESNTMPTPVSLSSPRSPHSSPKILLEELGVKKVSSDMALQELDFPTVPWDSLHSSSYVSFGLKLIGGPNHISTNAGAHPSQIYDEDAFTFNDMNGFQFEYPLPQLPVIGISNSALQTPPSVPRLPMPTWGPDTFQASSYIEPQLALSPCYQEHCSVSAA